MRFEGFNPYKDCEATIFLFHLNVNVGENKLSFIKSLKGLKVLSLDGIFV